MGRPLLLLLGDSITEKGSQWQNDGWVCLLLNRYNRSADIAQRGQGGYTTNRFMTTVMDTITNDLATTLHPQLITLWLGANDAALPDGPAGRIHVPIPKYKANLHSMVATFKSKAPQAKIVLITPPTVDDDKRKDKDGRHDRTNAAAGEYARACCQVANEAGVQALDLYSQLNAMPVHEWKGMLIDGLHLNKKGNTFMEQQLVDLVKREFPDLQRQLDQWEFPAFADEESEDDGELVMMEEVEDGVEAPSALDAAVAWLRYWLG